MERTEPSLLDRLPHAPPWLLATWARIEENGTECTGGREVAAPDPAANPHGFLPSSLLLELMAQIAGLVLPESSTGAYVAALRDVRWHAAARQGEPLTVRAKLHRRMGSLYLFECRAEARHETLATGTITLHAY